MFCPPQSPLPTCRCYSGRCGRRGSSPSPQRPGRLFRGIRAAIQAGPEGFGIGWAPVCEDRKQSPAGLGAHSQGFGGAAARRCCTLRWKWRGCLGVSAEACSASQVRAEPLDASEGKGQAWGPPSALIL